MNRETSVYLDVVRLSAAMVVFLGHVSGMRMTGGLLWQFAPYMSQAVTVFFVLSGFVIGFVADGRENTPVAYATSRLARIYSVALPVLLLTFALDAAGRWINAPAYSIVWGYHADGAVWQFLAGLVFINEIWFSHITQGSNLPYWSLGYEVWYYFMFGVLLFTRRRWLWGGLAMLAVGPAILAMFPLWLLGVAAYRATRVRLSVGVGIAMWLGSMACWVGYELWAARHGRLINLAPTFLRRPELVQDYLVGPLFAANLVGFHAAAPLFARPVRALSPAVRWAAGMTFTLYLLHLPVAQFLSAASPWPHGSVRNRLLVLLGTLVVVALVAEVTERRKTFWRRSFEQLFAHLQRTPGGGPIRPPALP